MFRKILLATCPGPSHHGASDLAAMLARREKAKLCVFHTCGGEAQPAEDLQHLSSSGQVDRIRSEMEAEYRPKLEGIPDWTVVVVPGVPQNEILRTARKEKTDLIVLGPHAPQEPPVGGRASGLIGATLETISQKARCPVVLVSGPLSGEEFALRRIVAATDFSPLAGHALSLAARLAGDMGAKLLVFHVLDIGPKDERDRFYRNDVRRRITAVKDRMEAEYATALAGVNHSFDAWEGIPWVEILKFSRWKDADLLVLAHHSKESDPETTALGSTIAHVARYPTCPILTINRDVGSGP